VTPRASVSLARVVRVLRAAGVLTELRGSGDLSVSGTSQDSRRVSPGDLFLAWKGTARDAHDFVEDAARDGATAAVVERFLDLPLPQIRVPDGRRAAAIVAHLLAGSPSEGMRMAAITGTNGKTTTSLLVRHLLSGLGPAAALGTLGLTGPDGTVRAGTENLTTPGPVELAEVLARLREEGIVAVALEASSHALDQRRLDGVRFDVAAFTNLTRDHLDYHGTLEAYLEAKGHLLLLLREGGGVVVNGEDPAWANLPQVATRWMVFRKEGGALRGVPPFTGERLEDLVAEDISLTGEGTRFRVRWGGEDAAVSLPLLGAFNVENALTALGVALLLGIAFDAGVTALSAAPPVPGRLELTVTDPVPVILDYAHTPHALESVLATLRPLYSGRLIVVFGAGGDRDREKRPEMGRVAALGADLSIVTSDNPRTEDPDAIVDEILTGMKGASFERITDRRTAIARALRIARPGDAVLLAGKGHETYQILGTERHPFDERVVVREILDAGRAA